MHLSIILLFIGDLKLYLNNRIRVGKKCFLFFLFNEIFVEIRKINLKKIVHCDEELSSERKKEE